MRLMPKIAVFVGGELSWFATDFDYYVGVDRAALWLLDKGLPLNLAVGDFDSVSPDEFERIQCQADCCVLAPAEKDDTDTELALKMVLAEFPDAQITIFGAFGGRIDHMLSNLFIPSDLALAPYMSQIHLEDATNHISYCPSGVHEIFPTRDMTYISFLYEGQGKLEILGAKYELLSENYFQKKIYSSNEFAGQAIRLTVPDGYVMIIQSKDVK